MYIARCVLVVVALHVGIVHSWDIAIGVKDQLIFYTSGTKTNTVKLISQNPSSLVYDEIHNVILYVDKQNNNDAVCGYYLSSEQNKCYITRNGRNIRGLTFDPVTEKIFFTDTIERSINWISLKPGFNNNVNGNLLIKMDDRTPTDISVDSCRGNIYWSNKMTETTGWLERAQLDGSNRQAILQVNNYRQFSIFVDPQTQKLYYLDICISCGWWGAIRHNEFNGASERYLFGSFNELRDKLKLLTVSKDYIYFVNSSYSYDSVWQYHKSTANSHIAPKEIITNYDGKTLGIIAKYKIQDQIKGIQDCDSLSSLKPATTVSSACENYCLHGNCTFSVEGLPQCRCNAGYSGQRCDVNECHNYCLNDGECSLNEEDEPVCQCVGNHEGPRCEADINDTTPTNDLAKRNLTLADLLSTFRKPSSKMYLTVEV